MAASSPVPSSSCNEAAVINGGLPPGRSILLETPKQSLRGLNKPKCFRCGNVARSRCPFQSCKSCCAKAQNPCHIHVLKANATLPDKSAPSSSPSPQLSTADASGSLRPTSVRQLSNKFSQFSGLNGPQAPVRARRLLSLKDAATINAWRFSKLKEYNDGNLEAENEAFDRYMQNVSLLEEAFFPDESLELPCRDFPPLQNSTSLFAEGDKEKLILGIKAKLKSNIKTTLRCRQRVQELIDQGLKKLQKHECEYEAGSTCADDVNGERESKKPKTFDKWIERTAMLNDLLDKLNSSRCVEELKTCLQIKRRLFNDKELGEDLASGKSDLSANEVALTPAQVPEKIDMVALLPRQELETEKSTLPNSGPKLCTAVEINKSDLSSIDMHFSSLDQIARF